jgi:hypothetical protein
MITPPAATPPATDLATEIAQAALAAVPGGKLISTQVTIKGYAAQVETPSGATVLVLLNKQFDVLDIVTESATPPLAAPTAAAVARAALTAVPGSALLRTEATQNGYAAQVYSPLGVHLLVVLTKQLDVVDILTVPAGE